VAALGGPLFIGVANHVQWVTMKYASPKYEKNIEKTNIYVYE
jgi:hypothetical protein